MDPVAINVFFSNPLACFCFFHQHPFCMPIPFLSSIWSKPFLFLPTIHFQLELCLEMQVFPFTYKSCFFFHSISFSLLRFFPYSMLYAFIFIKMYSFLLKIAFIIVYCELHQIYVFAYFSVSRELNIYFLTYLIVSYSSELIN